MSLSPLKAGLMNYYGMGCNRSKKADYILIFVDGETLLILHGLSRLPDT